MSDETNMNGEQALEKPSIIGMIMNPGVQFERIKTNPKVLIAIIVVTVLTIIGMYMMTQGIDYTSDPQLAGMAEDEKKIMEMGMQIGILVVALFTPIVSILISSAIYLIIAKIVRSDATFKQLFSMSTYIYVIGTLGVIVNGLAMMLVGGGDVDTQTLFTSVNSIVGAEGALGGFLNSLEIFQIWGMIITALGLQLVAKFSKGLSWGIVIAFYVVTTGFTMLSAAFTSMVGV